MHSQLELCVFIPMLLAVAGEVRAEKAPPVKNHPRGSAPGEPGHVAKRRESPAGREVERRPSLVPAQDFGCRSSLYSCIYVSVLYVCVFTELDSEATRKKERTNGE